MGASPRLDIRLSYPGGMSSELVAKKAELIVASGLVIDQARQQGDKSDTNTSHVLSILQSMIASFHGQEEGKVAFSLVARLEQVDIPPNKRYIVILIMLEKLGIQIDDTAKSMLADQYPAQG